MNSKPLVLLAVFCSLVHAADEPMGEVSEDCYREAASAADGCRKNFDWQKEQNAKMSAEAGVASQGAGIAGPASTLANVSEKSGKNVDRATSECTRARAHVKKYCSAAAQKAGTNDKLMKQINENMKGANGTIDKYLGETEEASKGLQTASRGAKSTGGSSGADEGGGE